MAWPRSLVRSGAHRVGALAAQTHARRIGSPHMLPKEIAVE
jgi:hypothetical protein